MPAMPVEDRQETVISADGTPIAYVRIGEGRPVVVVHGGFGSWRSWSAAACEVADRYAFALMDRRGRGGSGWGSEPHALRHEVDDVLAVLDAVRPGAALVGHSIGGILALEATHAEPDLVERLILYEPAFGFGIDDPATLDALATSEDRAALVRETLRQMAASGGISVREKDAALAAEPSAAWDGMLELAPTVRRELVAVAGYDWDPSRFEDLATPTLVILGEASGANHRRNCEQLVEALPAGQLVTLPGQGHVAHIGDPSGLAAVLATFLDA